MALGKKANAYLQPFYRRLGTEFSDFVPRGVILVHTPVEWLLGGFLMDPYAHGDKSERWLSYFVDPLASPHEYPAIGHGERFPCNQWRSAQTVFVRHEDDRIVLRTIDFMLEIGLPLLRPMLSLEGFYAYLIARGNAETRRFDTHRIEALASTAMVLRRFDEALAHLEYAFAYGSYYHGYLEGPLDRLYPWDQAQVLRFRLLRDHLRAGREDAASAQLEEWRDYTAGALGIEDLMVRVSDRAPFPTGGKEQQRT